MPSDLRLFACPLPCFPAITSFAIAVTDLDTGLGFEVLPLPSRLLTSALTFSYSALDIPNDFLRVSLPLPCLPAMTSSAICLIVLPVGLLVDGLLGLTVILPPASTSFLNCALVTPKLAK